MTSGYHEPTLPPATHTAAKLSTTTYPATHTTEVNPMPITGFAGGFGLGPTNTRLNDQPIPQTGIAYPAPTANGQLQAALAKAQGQMNNPVFDAKNPHYGNRYASLAAIHNAVRKALSDNGVCVTHTIHEKGTVLRTTLGKDGQEIISEYPLIFTGDDQKFGSRLTYAKRYNLASMCGVAGDEDDDAEAASKVDNSPVTPEQVEHLKILIDSMETGVEARLLTYMGTLLKRKITKLEEIPAAQFPTAFAVLEKKRTGKTPPKEPPK